MSFFSKVEGWMKKFFTSTKWETIASTTLTLTAPLLEEVVLLAAGGPAETAVSNVINQCKADLAGAAVLIQDAQTPLPTTVKAQIQNLLTSFSANIKTLLADADVKNTANADKIIAAVTTIDGEAQAILTAIP